MRLLGKKGLSPAYVILAAILAVNLFLKIRFFSGLCQADDFSYGVYAFSFFRLPFPWDMTVDFRALRLALLLPLSLIFRVLTPGEFTAVLYPMLASFGTVVLVFLIGRRLAGAAAGLFAAGVFAVFPGDVIYGTMLLPDVLAPFYLTAAVWAFLKAGDASPKAKWWHLAAGVSMFLAFSARENSYYFVLFFLPFAFSAERWRRGLYYTVAGFAVPVLLLYALYGLKSGDFLYNLHLAENQRDPLIRSGYIPRNADNWFRCLWYMLPGVHALPNGTRMFASPLFGATFYLGIPCLAYAAVKGALRRDRMLLLAPWWFLAGYLFLEFGSISFDRYQMMLKLPRFLLTLTPAMAVGCGIVLGDAFWFGRSRATGEQGGSRKAKAPPKRKGSEYRYFTIPVACAVSAWLLFTSWEAMTYQNDSLERNMQAFRWGYRDVLKGRPRKPVYGTGGWWNNKLSFYLLPDIRFADMPWRRSDMLRDLKTVKNPAELADSYIVLDRTNFTGQNDLRIRHSYDDFGSWILFPPKEWKLLGANYHTEIYEVPAGWTYTEPEGKALAYGLLLHALRMDDFMLFFFSLHPDFVKTLTEERFWSLFSLLKDEKNPERAELLNKRLVYREDNGKVKIDFNLK